MTRVNQARLVTSREVANQIGVAPSTIARWARKGVIPSIRLSTRCVRYDLQTVLAALSTERGGSALMTPLPRHDGARLADGPGVKGTDTLLESEHKPEGETA